MRVFTDWEGPWVLTDFAYEVAIAVFNNHEFFERLSQYDDYLYLIERRQGYEVGDTLRLLAPFLVAADVSSDELREIAERTLRYVPDADEAMGRLISKGFEPVVISTAYEQFLEVSAKPLGVGYHCTKFRPEDYKIPSDEKEFLIEAVEIIASLPEIEIPPDSESLKAVKWLDDFFWRKLRSFKVWRVIEEVKAMGGRRKLEVLKGYGVENPIVIGDSISDVDMMSWARERGLSISFNGNEYAVSNAKVAVISETALAEVYVVEAYARDGFEGVKRASSFEFDSDLVERLKGTRIYIIEGDNLREIVRTSKDMRRRLRGLAGSLS